MYSQYEEHGDSASLGETSQQCPKNVLRGLNHQSIQDDLRAWSEKLQQAEGTAPFPRGYLPGHEAERLQRPTINTHQMDQSDHANVAVYELAVTPSSRIFELAATPPNPRHSLDAGCCRPHGPRDAPLSWDFWDDLESLSPTSSIGSPPPYTEMSPAPPAYVEREVPMGQTVAEAGIAPALLEVLASLSSANASNVVVITSREDDIVSISFGVRLREAPVRRRGGPHRHSDGRRNGRLFRQDEVEGWVLASHGAPTA